MIDAANGRKAPAELLVAGSRRVGRAASDAGVRHHLVISIVGCDAVPVADYRASVLHFAFHATHLDGFSTADAMGELLTLGLLVVLPAVAVWAPPARAAPTPDT